MRQRFVLGCCGVLITAMGLSPRLVQGTADEEVVVLFKALPMELPAESVTAGPEALVSCDSTLQAVMAAHSVDLVSLVVPDFAQADTSWTTPEGLIVRLADLSRLVMLHAPASEVDSLVADLSDRPDVVFAERNAANVATTVPNDPYFNRQWALNPAAIGSSGPSGDVRAIAAWDLIQGSSTVKIGIQDPTGVVWAGHPDLSGKVSGQAPSQFPYVPLGDHATLCAGIAAANGNENVGIAGVAWNSQIVTRYDPTNATTVSSTNAMLKAGVAVINDSWTQGSNHYFIASAVAFADAYKANVLTVVAMPEDGGEGRESIYPCVYNWGLNVAATGPDGAKAYYSHSHYFVSLGAPGGDDRFSDGSIYSDLTQSGGTYGAFVGTSLAAPHVAGAAALLKAYDPSLYNDDIAGLLTISADDVNASSAPGFDNDIGWGRLNIRSAIARMEAPYSLIRPASNGGTTYATLANAKRTLVSIPGLVDGTYFVTPKEVRKTITFAATYALPPSVWGRGVETIGYANTNPNFGVGWCAPVDGSVTKTGCTIRTYVFDVRYTDGTPLGYVPCDAGSVHLAYSIDGIKDLVSPTSTVLSPNGGQTLTGGDQVVIGWQSTDEYIPGVTCTIQLQSTSPNGSTTVWTIASNRHVVGAGVGSYTWTVPGTVPSGTTFKIKVISYDTNNHQGVDVSDNYFTINNAGKGGEDPPPYPCESPCPFPQLDGPNVTDLLPFGPNPFRSETQVRFTLDGTHRVVLKVFDVQGRLLNTLFTGSRSRGLYEMRWDGTDEAAGVLPSGVYFVTLTTERASITRKVVIVR